LLSNYLRKLFTSTDAKPTSNLKPNRSTMKTELFWSMNTSSSKITLSRRHTLVKAMEATPRKIHTGRIPINLNNPLTQSTCSPLEGDMS
jgi:hypothetical protein